MSSNNSDNMLRITLVKSVINSQKRHRQTVQALGLKKIRQTVEKPDNDATRGMVRLVSHLVEVEEIQESQESQEVQGS